MNFAKTLGLGIFKRREECDFTQARLASEIGLDRKHGESLISRWESGRVSPSAENLLKLANAMNCSIDFFYGELRQKGVTF